MPQVDLTSVCAGDPKVTCETTAITTVNGGDDSPPPPPPPPQNPDYAPDSFWLSKDAELDWLDRNAFLDRKDSGKASNNPNAFPNNPNPNSGHVSVGSQRYSTNNLKSKASLISLPKPQKQNYAEVKSRRHHIRPSSVRLFPKKSEQTKPGLGLSEPGSPKVSCMGRVRSRKERNRRAKNRKKVNEPGLVRVKSIKERKKNGFWKNIGSIFKSKSNKMESKSQQDEDFIDVIKEKSVNINEFDEGNYVNSTIEPPSLGGMKRFASGRKSDVWAGDVEVNGAMSEPLDRSGGGPIWRRRDVGPPLDLDVDRDWRTVGPVSV